MKKDIYPKNRFSDRMFELGYRNLGEFYRKSGVSGVSSREICRRLIIGNHPPMEHLFIKILQYLQYNPNEIRELLLEYGFTDFINLIGDHSGEVVRPDEKALIRLVKKLVASNSSIGITIINILDSLCRACGLECSRELSVMRETKLMDFQPGEAQRDDVTDSQKEDTRDLRETR